MAHAGRREWKLSLQQTQNPATLASLPELCLQRAFKEDTGE